MEASPDERQRRAAEDAASTEELQLNDHGSVQRWAAALGTTDEALIGAAQAVGTRIDRIKEYLGAGGMAPRQEDG